MNTKKIKCVSCGNVLHPLFEDDYDMVDGAIVGKISAGYGSKCDGDIFQIGICDNCIDKLVKENKIKKIGNYLQGD